MDSETSLKRNRKKEQEQQAATGTNPLKDKLDAAAGNSNNNPVKTQLKNIAASNKPATGGGTATPAAAETTASASADWNPYAYDPVTGQALARYQNEIYNPSQAVNDALANLSAISGQQPGAYAPGQGVTNAQDYLNQLMGQQTGAYAPSQATQNAQAQMEAAQANKPGAYEPSAEVMAAQQALEALQGTKPQGYTSKYQPQMDALLEQIQNPGQFKYEFNGDNLFKMYADEYTQRGKQASMDAMGQAAALTGGYGNSYAQQVGNQAYDQYLTQLYDRGMDLRDRAYEAWLNEQQNKYNQYGLLADADNTDYGRYRDTVGDWQNERGYLTDRYNNERNLDYNRYRDTVGDWENNRDYYTNLYGNERNFDYNQYNDAYNRWASNRDYAANQLNTERNYDYNLYSDAYDRWANNRDYAANRYDTERNVDYNMYTDRANRAEEQYQYDASMQENIRQFNESLNWDKMSNDQKYAADYALSILAMGEMPTDAMLQAAGLSKADAEKLKAKLATGGGTGGKKTEDEYQDPTNAFYVKNVNGENVYYTYGTDANGSRSEIEVPSYLVKNNDLVHNIYTEGAERRKSNKNKSSK